jgi:hypothetical protein
MNWTKETPKKAGFYWATQGNQKTIIEVTPNLSVWVMGHNILLNMNDFDTFSDVEISQPEELK